MHMNLKYRILQWTPRREAVISLGEELNIIPKNSDNSWILDVDNKLYDFLFKTLLNMRDLGVLIYDGRDDMFKWNEDFELSHSKIDFIDHDSDNMPF